MFCKKFLTCTDENPFSFNKEQIPKEVAFGEGTFFSRFARNRTNLFKSFKSLRYGWINYAGRPVRPTRYQPRATPWESVEWDCRPGRAKALPKYHSFAISGRIYPFPTTQGVALGYELVALSGRFNRRSINF